MTPAIYTGLPESAYADLPGVRASTLKAFRQSGLIGVASLTAAPAPDTAAMRLGTAVHAAILEPEKFAARWVEVKGLKPGAVPNTWAKADADLEADDLYPLAEGWADQIAAMTSAVRKHLLAGPLVRASHCTEVSVCWQDQSLGVEGKARIDAVAGGPEAPCILDIKTTKARSLSEFERDAGLFGYHLQAAWYIRGALLSGLVESEPGFAFIAVTNYDPIDVVVFEPCEDMLRQGRVDCERALARYKRWLNHGDAEGMVSGIVPLDLPKWLKDETEPNTDWSAV